MNRLARKGLVSTVCAVSAMVAGGVLASAGYAQADSAAGGDAKGSPGIGSGNDVQVPVHVPVNVCGDTLSVVGLLNTASGADCRNTSTPAPPAPPAHTPQPAPPADSAPPAPALAHTGAGGVGAAAAGGLALLLGGTVLYRRARSTAGR